MRSFALGQWLIKLLSYLGLSAYAIGVKGAEVLGGVLKQLNALSHLGLYGNQLRDKGVQRLALGQCKSLSFLDIAACDIGPVGAGVLAIDLGQCTMLSQLRVSFNAIPVVVCEGAGVMAGMIKQYPQFFCIELGYNGIQAEGAGRIVAVLGRCASLSHIDLRHDNIGD